MPIPGAGFNSDGKYVNPNFNDMDYYDPTLSRLDANNQLRSDFYTHLTFPSELSTLDIKYSEIRDFMEIEVLKIIGQKFEHFMDNTGNDNFTKTQILEQLNDSQAQALNLSESQAAGGALDFNNIKNTIEKTSKQIGANQLFTDNTKLRDQTLDKIAKIWLYEPASIQSQYGIKYSDEDLSATKKAFELIPLASDGKIPGQILKQGITNIVATAVEGAAKVGKIINAEKALGGQINVRDYVNYKSRSISTPLMEYLFNGISRRKFSFAWKFYPKNHQDVMNVYQIIRTLKKNAHPSRLGAGFYLKYPNIFKIRHLFYNTEGKIAENVYLNRIKPCVLENITVNYTDSNGYVVFDKEFDMDFFETDNKQSKLYKNGKGKSPIGIQLQLEFAELELLLSEDFEAIEPSETNPYLGGGY
jgi:hypothetical protein